MAFWRNRFGPVFIPRYSEFASNASRSGDSTSVNPGSNGGGGSGGGGNDGTSGGGGEGGPRVNADGGPEPGNDNEYLDIGITNYQIGNLLRFFPAVDTCRYTK